MPSIIETVNQKFKKDRVTDVKSGDTVRVHQRIREGDKVRTQVFEGMVIATRRMNSHTASITVRRIASGVGVEKSFLLHSPLVEKIEVVKRTSVRRDKLNYMRARSGKSARLSAVEFDRDSVNVEEASATAVDEAADVVEADTTEVETKPETDNQTTADTDKLATESTNQDSNSADKSEATEEKSKTTAD